MRLGNWRKQGAVVRRTWVQVTSHHVPLQVRHDVVAMATAVA